MTGYRDIDAQELHAMLAEQKVLLIDVRNPDEVARGVIHGAFHVPLHLIPVKVDDLKGELPLVFYCHSGMRSAQASAFMTNKGRGNVYNLQGGILAWGKAGYPFEALK